MKNYVELLRSSGRHVRFIHIRLISSGISPGKLTTGGLSLIEEEYRKAMTVNFSGSEKTVDSDKLPSESV